ncbi:hypothetical protein Tco_0893396 [Tanacetum coccineum]|uniref:Uncharacterized protein n=1 Tax=Tanacetum coccineum TaxID=301880 RepID=A0ABQ4XFX9_9ASTR
MTNERTQDILNKSKRNHNANSERFTEWEEEERKGDEMDLMVWAGDGGGYWQWARDGDGCWQWGWRWWVMAKGGVVGREMVGWVREV